MIDTALILLRDELSSFINTSKKKIDHIDTDVILDNIGMFEAREGSDELSDSIVITLVNVEEESALKNTSALKRPLTGNSGIYQNPPVFINLYVLFACNYSGKDVNGYSLALSRLFYVIQFFQSKNSFSVASSVAGGGGNIHLDWPGISSVKFTMELYSLSFEQINYLWGSLGGRQVPFVMYKLRLIAVSEDAVIREVPLVEEIQTTIIAKK